MRSPDSVAASHRIMITVALAVIIALPLGMLVDRVRASDGSATLARSHAEVIAHGDVQLEQSELAWRVARFTAELPSAKTTQPWPVGFVLATQVPILLTDARTGDEKRLAAGEADLVRPNRPEQRFSLGAGPASYDVFELVPAGQVKDVGSGDLDVASGAIDSSDGTHDMNLVRDLLTPNESGQMAGPGTLCFLFVTSGTVEDETSPGSLTVALNAGDGKLLSGNLTIKATVAENVTYVVAVIAVEVTTPPAESTSRTVLLTEMACPVGLEPVGEPTSQRETQCTVPFDGVPVGLVAAGESPPQQTHGGGHGMAGLIDRQFMQGESPVCTFCHAQLSSTTAAESPSTGPIATMTEIPTATSIASPIASATAA